MKMKHIRKIAVVLLCVIFFVGVIIGMGIIFAVKNVNVTLETYKYSVNSDGGSAWDGLSEEQQAEAQMEIDGFKSRILDKYRGTLIGFVDDSGLASCMDNSGYIYVSFERVYPCTINVVIKERRETFSVAKGDGTYKSYDSLGVYLPGDDDNLNNLDGAENLIIKPYSENGQSGYVITDGDVARIAAIAEIFKEQFGGLRTVAESISFNPEYKFVEFAFRCGVTLRVMDFEVLSGAKMEAAKAKFDSLTGEQKTKGVLSVSTNGENRVVAGYADI